MLDFRLYRLAFIPAVLAAVIGAFSLAGIPPALRIDVTTQVFDDDSALTTTHQLIRAAPDRAPGSAGDSAAARFVQERFQAISSGTVATQKFDGPDGDSLENVLITLPGSSDRTIVLLAGRDSDRVPAAASSAAATALLVELAAELGGSDHAATLVLASVDGTTQGSVGTRELIDGLADGDQVDAAIVISQPGARERTQPLLVTSSTGTRSTSAQLVETASQLLASSGAEPTTREGALGDLARLAFPTGLGEQAPLIADGIDAVALTSAGEPPLPASRDTEDQLGKESLAGIGRTAIALVSAIDRSPSLEHGPTSYIRFAGNLVPGWTLALLALALLAPPIALGAGELARQSRRRGGLAPLGSWVARLALPPLAALIAIYALALVGILPSPPFPFDPRSLHVGGSELLALAFLAALTLGIGFLERIWRPPAGCPRQAVAAVGGTLGILACLLAWLANPYLALLLAPVPHIWIASCRRERSGLFTLVISALCVLPVLAAVIEVASALNWGASAPWQLVVLVADGQVGLLVSLAFVLAWASPAASLVAARTRPAADASARRGAIPGQIRATATVEPPFWRRG